MGCQTSRPIDEGTQIPNVTINAQEENNVPQSSTGPDQQPEPSTNEEMEPTQAADSTEEPPRDGRLRRLTSRFRERRARNRRPLTPEEELEQLQHDLETMERLFRSLLGHSFAEGIGYEESFEDERRDENYCPPASRHAIKTLPIIEVRNDDLKEECNRECCICFYGHSVGSKVVRLPCGHLFHRDCISEWLNKRCTCPICRWEMETDDRYYEVERIERMRQRRLRLKSHDLERMSLKELKELAKSRMEHSERKACGNSKSELIKRLRHCSNVEIVPLEGGEEEKEEICLSSERKERKLRNIFVGN